MQKLILLLLLFAPFGLFAQSYSEAQLAHQQAENQLVSRYPQAKKIDLEALSLQQKDQHKKCNSCQQKKQQQPPKLAAASSKSLTELKADQKRLIAIVKHMHDNQSNDAQLLTKYKRALSLNNQKIRLIETQLSNYQKNQQQLKSKATK